MVGLQLQYGINDLNMKFEGADYRMYMGRLRGNSKSGEGRDGGNMGNLTLQVDCTGQSTIFNHAYNAVKWESNGEVKFSSSELVCW